MSGSLTVTAANVDVTAEFSPSLERPENNEFINTTPQSGYCVNYSEQCVANKVFSISLGGLTTALISDGIKKIMNQEPLFTLKSQAPSEILLRPILLEGFISVEVYIFRFLGEIS